MAVQSPYPRLLNIRSYVVDELTTRPGESLLSLAPLDQLIVHTIRRLNDSVPGAPQSFCRVVGAGTKLYTGQVGFGIRDTGYSGNPLDLVPWRPDQSPEPWMYVADSNKMAKVNVVGTTFQMGIAPPTVAPTPELAAPSFKIIDSFDALGGWSSAAPAGAIAVVSRASTTIAQILYDTGTTGWACIVPTTYPFTLQFHSLIIIDRAGGSKETVEIEEVSPATTATTIAGIMYDSGNTGACSIVLTAPKTMELGVKRNAVLLINSGGGSQEYVRVLSATEGTGNQWSLRTVTANNHVAGETVSGVSSFRAYCANTHAAAQTLDINWFQVTMGVPVGPNFFPAVLGNLLGAQLDLSVINGRPTQPEDEFHISIAVDNPANVVDGRIFLDVDSTAANQDFNHNYYYWVFRGSDLASATSTSSPLSSLDTQQQGVQRALIDQAAPVITTPRGARVGEAAPYGFRPVVRPPILGSKQGQTATGSVQASELVFKVKDLIRVGTDSSRTLANVINLRITLNVTASTVMNVGAWTLGGSYGPDIGDTGGPVFYRYRPRSSLTGAKGNPSPATRYGLLPHRAQITVPLTQHSDAQVDKLDIFRFGGDITSGWPYVGTVANGATPSFNDVYQDSDILDSPLLDFDNFQPFPTIDITRSGTCDVVGTSVKYVSGDQFNTRWAEGSEITISGQPYTLYKQPASTTFLEIVENAGNQTGVSFFLQEPTLLAQPEPSLWGPFYGQFFAVGDPYQSGYVLRTKGNDPDSASDRDQDEVTNPSDPMMHGCLYGSSANFVWSSEKMFEIVPGQDAQGNLTFQYIEVVGSGGLFARDALSSGTVMAWLRKDSIAVSTGGVGQSITEDLKLLFPHDGGPGVPVQLGSVTFQPPDMTQTAALRLSEEDGHIIFDYIDVNSNRQSIVYSLQTGVWSLDSYGVPVVTHYSEEGQGVHSLLVGGNDGNLYQLLGSTDAGAAFACSVRMPYIGDAFASFSHVRDGYIGLLSSAALNFVVNAEGVDSLVALASTGGNYAKVYAVLPAVKAKAWEYGLEGNAPFTLYSRDTFVRQKPWGGDYSPLQPFLNLRRLTT